MRRPAILSIAVEARVVARMEPLSTFAAAILRTAALSGATPTRFCVTIGMATLLTGFEHPADRAFTDGLDSAINAFGVILGCVAGLALAGFIGAAALLPLRGRRPAATMLGEGFGAGLGAGLVAAMLLAVLAGVFQTARLVDAI